MDVVSSQYPRPPLLFNRHLETVYPALFRKVHGISYQRERISTPDEDFLDLDWLKQESNKLVILSHGLEGNTQRAYIRGMAKAFYTAGYDILTWNYRGCSEEMNRQLRFYHSGATDDLGVVVEHALQQKNYTSISLIGFSLGGNLTLKYLGEMGQNAISKITSAVAFSVPLSLEGSCTSISKYTVYAQRFLRSLKEKVITKSRLMKELDVKGIGKINSLLEFDDRYTAPIHQFSNAYDYYNRCSSIHFVDKIQIPTLIVNAKNDPFLDHSVNTSSSLHNNEMIRFETPDYGGHVGFTLFNQNGLYWSELRALKFINNV